MEHFYQNIEGWFTFETLYSYVLSNSSNDSHFVEVGTWKGRSAAYMAVEIINSGKNIKFDCIDPFIAVGDELPQYKITSEELKNSFIENMKPVENYYKLYDIGSPEVTSNYKDESLDFVFIDGDHSFDAVVKDINAWLPKMKPGSILAGHDYAWCDDVRNAVNSIFGNKNWGDIWGCGCWIIRIPKKTKDYII